MQNPQKPFPGTLLLDTVDKTLDSTLSQSRPTTSDTYHSTLRSFGSDPIHPRVLTTVRSPSTQSGTENPQTLLDPILSTRIPGLVNLLVSGTLFSEPQKEPETPHRRGDPVDTATRDGKSTHRQTTDSPGRAHVGVVWNSGPRGTSWCETPSPSVSQRVSQPSTRTSWSGRLPRDSLEGLLSRDPRLQSP